MDLSGVLWIGGVEREAADQLGARFGIGVRHVAGDGFQAFRALLEELQGLPDERLIVAGDLPPTAVAAVLRTPGQAVFLTDDRDVRVLRLQSLPPAATVDELAAALGLSGAGDTSP
jgi:hypothetical protein